MLCYVMLRYVMLCYYIMLCYVMLCYVMLCYVMLSYVILCYVMDRDTLIGFYFELGINYRDILESLAVLHGIYISL